MIRYSTVTKISARDIKEQPASKQSAEQIGYNSCHGLQKMGLVFSTDFNFNPAMDSFYRTGKYPRKYCVNKKALFFQYFVTTKMGYITFIEAVEAAVSH